MADDDDYGCIVQCDLHIPKRLHDKFTDLPFTPEKLSLTTRKSSPPKLVGTLHDKEKYVVHYKYLKVMMKHGVQVIKIHRAIWFKQKAWMKSYIEKNTILRQSAKNYFERIFFKLMCNSC